MQYVAVEKKFVEMNPLQGFWAISCSEKEVAFNFTQEMIEKRKNNHPHENFIRLEAKEANETFLVTITQLDFFSSHRIWIIFNAELLSRSISQKIIEILPNLPSETAVLFWFHSSATQPLYEWIKKNKRSCLIESEKIWEKKDRLITWIIHKVRSENKKIEVSVAASLAERMHYHPVAIENELKKLTTYVGNLPSIREQDIEAITYHDIHHTIWQLREALLSNNHALIWSIFQKLIQEAPALIFLAQLRKVIEQLVRIFYLSQTDEGKVEIEKECFFLKGKKLNDMITKIHTIGVGELERWLELIFETELALKTQGLPERLLLEIFIFKSTIFQS